MKCASKFLAFGVLLAAFTCLGPTALSAPAEPDAGFWQRIHGRQNPPGLANAQSALFKIDRGRCEQALSKAPPETPGALRRSVATLSLPMPDGSLMPFRILETSVMAPELAARFPRIKTYLGQSLADPSVTLRMDSTPAGLHAHVRTPAGAVQIDPAPNSDPDVYVSYYEADLGDTDVFECRAEVEPDAQNGAVDPHIEEAAEKRQAIPGVSTELFGPVLRTYRLAVASSGEYTAFHGGVEGAMAAIVTAINRVNSLFETEFAARLVLVANNHLIIFTNSATDPYPENLASTNTIPQNQIALDTIIGNANYDVGHVFFTLGGGIANLNSVCNNSFKGRAATGFPNLLGGLHRVRVLMHEFGHQFGAHHTFNSNLGSCANPGQYNAPSAYELGSGSTIMSYCGNCGNDNLQFRHDIYYHSFSLDRILAHVARQFEGPWKHDAARGVWYADGQQAGLGVIFSTRLNTAPVTVSEAGMLRLSFSHRWSFQPDWDGGQVRVSINGGPYNVVANSAFIENGYNGTVKTNGACATCGISQLEGQEAFVSESADHTNGLRVTSMCELGVLSVGDTVSVQFLYGGDNHTRGRLPNWEIDSVTVTTSGGSVLRSDDFNTSDGGYVVQTSSASCAVITPTENLAPIVDAGPDYIIPVSTMFTLRATGSDPDGDPITYCWEQRDLGPILNLETRPADNGSSPLFRSFPPTTNPARTFNNATRLPTTSRTLHFRVTARDNMPGGGGVSGDDAEVQVLTNAGPFVVTAPNSAVTWSGSQTVNWAVAGTAGSPIAATHVNILLSTNGGGSLSQNPAFQSDDDFPIVLAANTPNDGSETINLPAIYSTQARIKVEAVGNIFFDISDVNFTLMPPGPVIIPAGAVVTVESCSPANQAIDPEETVTVSFALRNIGLSNATELTATLLASDEVLAPSGPQIINSLIANGPSAAIPLSFTLGSGLACGASFTARVEVRAGANHLATVAFPLRVGRIAASSSTFRNTVPINLNDLSSATPYPSSITVSGLTGVVAKVVATLSNLTSSRVFDYDVLLSGPQGQTVFLMGDVCYVSGTYTVTLTFDDDAPAVLPELQAPQTGRYRPTNYFSEDVFFAPAPQEPWGESLSVFRNTNPNGEWRLFVMDGLAGGAGSIQNGWSLTLFTDDPDCCPYQQISIADATLTEGSGGSAEARFAVELSAPSVNTVMLDYQTISGTAKPWLDYTPASGRLTFVPGVTSAIVAIPISVDIYAEPEETFSVRLRNPVKVLIARAEAIGRIIDDDGLPGQVDHFEWSIVPSPQYQDYPFVAVITAKDAAGRVPENFTGPVTLSAIGPQENRTVGTGASTWTFPFFVSYHQARLQSIYLTNEIGASGRITALALDVVTPPSQALSNWTIRLQQTQATNFPTASWLGSGWTVVHQSDAFITSTGWVTFPFLAPFEYNSASNLIVDFSFNNTSSGTNGTVRYTARAGRTVYNNLNNLTFGDPLDWAGLASPAALTATRVVNLRFALQPFLPVSPATSGSFVAGSWLGTAAVPVAASNVFLVATDQQGHTGTTSQGFAVESAADSDADGLIDAWELRFFPNLVSNTATDDPDTDRLNNSQEFAAGTNPNDSTSTLRIISAEHDGALVRITFHSVRGRAYRLETTPQLPAPFWTAVTQDAIGNDQLLELAAPAPATTAFFRLRVMP